MKIHVKTISVPPKLYYELVELARRKGDTVNQVATDILKAELEKNAD